MKKKDPRRFNVIDKADAYLIDQMQSFVTLKAQRGVSIVELLRDFTVHGLASYFIVLVGAYFSSEGSSFLIISLCGILLTPIELSRWKRYSDESKKALTPEISAKIVKEADKSRFIFKYIRMANFYILLMLSVSFVLHGEWGDLPIFLFLPILIFRMYLDCAYPVPPSSKTEKRTVGDMIPQN